MVGMPDRTHLLDSEIEYLTRFIGHHTTGSGEFDNIFEVLKNKCEVMGIPDKGPLNIKVSKDAESYYPGRVIVKDMG
jgi:hypothetical protein